MSAISGLFPDQDENTLYLSRADVNELLGTFSRHGFFLDGKEWPSVEHYYQAMKFESESVQEKIRSATHPKQARRLGRSRMRKLRKDWRKVKVVMMTRAVYTKCKAHPEVAQVLLATGDQKLLENSMYDYFWGCGRDRLANNEYGKVLMRVRAKLKEESSKEED